MNIVLGVLYYECCEEVDVGSREVVTTRSFILQVSPGVKQLLSSFESLLADPSSGSRMAEIARMLGEKRMCRLEVDLFTLPVTIYSVEHEPLQEALHHLQSMVSSPVTRHNVSYIWLYKPSVSYWCPRGISV